jgi:hypothetical protein
MDVTILNLADDKDTSAENSLLHETNAMFPDSTVAGGVECFHDDTVSHLGGRYYVDLGVVFERLTSSRIAPRTNEHLLSIWYPHGFSRVLGRT